MTETGGTDIATVVPLRRPRASTVTVDDKTMIYDEVGHAVLVLNASASAVWARCDGARTVTGIVEDLAAEIELDPDEVADDIALTVAKLLDVGLLSDVEHAAGVRSTPGPSPSPSAPPGWPAPRRSGRARSGSGPGPR